MKTLTQERLKEVLHYDPKTGVFTRLVPRSGPRGRIGDVVGSITAKGYRSIRVDGVPHRASNLAVLFMLGVYPNCDVDHHNLDKGDDRWENLRSATRSQNCANVPMRVDNSSGRKGVTRHKGKWYAQISVSGKRKSLGYFSTLEGAYEAYMVAAKEAFGEYARG